MVEDDEVTARALTRVLRHRGHTVEHVSTVPDAQSRLKEGAYDVLLADRNVCGRIAWDLATEVPVGIHVVRMSGHAPIASPPYWQKGANLPLLFEMIEEH